MKITNMKNLNESSNINSEYDIDEQVRGTNVLSQIGGAKNFKGLSKTLQAAFKDMEVAIGLQKNPIMLGSKKLKTADDIFSALKDGSLVKNATELGRVEKGLLKSTSTDPALRKAIAVDFASDKTILAQFVKENKTNAKEIKDFLKSKGYPDSSINEIIAQMKKNGNMDSKGLFTVKGSNKVTPASKSLLSRTKELLDNIKIKKMSWKQLLAWGAGIGVGSVALWVYIKANSDVIPEGMPEKQPIEGGGEWSPCIQQMIDSKEGVIKTASNGSQLVSVKNSEYPEGLNFFSNGRVGDVKSKKKGTWKCKGEVVSINEIVGRILRETLLHEQGSEIDINTMTKYVDEAVDDLDGYVAIYNLNSLIKIITNLKGKTFQGKDALSQFLRFYKEDEGGDDFLSDVKSVGVRTLGTKGILAKEQLLSMLEGGGGSTQSTSGFSNIQITWDSPSESESTSEEGKTSGYRDCEGKDFPLEFGCKSSKIAEVQKCLGVTDDGKFGPNTKKALEDNKHDVSKGLTKDVYNLIKNNCGTPVKPPPTNTTTSTPDSVPPNTTTVTGETPTNIQMMPEPDGSVTNKTGEQIFKELMEKGLLKKDMFGRIKLKERNNDKIPIDVPAAEVEKLNVFLKTYKKGYTLGKQKDKSYGDKIVWVKK